MAAVVRIPDQVEFDGISLIRIGSRFTDYCQECIQWCGQYGLLATEMICPDCNRQCREQNLNRAIDGITGHCPVRQCKKRISIRHGSFFGKSHSQLWQILGITYLWCRSAEKSRGMSVEDFQHELLIGSERKRNNKQT